MNTTQRPSASNTHSQIKARALLSMFLCSVLTVLNGCEETSSAAGKAQSGEAQPNALSRGKALFVARCATCHGQTGKGDGPSAAALDPAPRDFSKQEWQGQVSDADIKKIIVGGGAAVGKSTAMPAAADLEKTPEDLEALVAYIRSLS